jgi:methylenetetrahydrofolate reductase (NADPH)
MEVSLELVPRNPDALKAGACIAARFAEISCINIPDLTRFSIRSWEACGMLAAFSREGIGFMPHLRARDFDLDAPFPLTGFFREHGITRALVIAGDPPVGLGAGAYQGGIDKGAGTIPFIKKLKKEVPELEIYAAFDPYRTNIRYELDYLREKEDAGASGFMSQPFFDLRLLEIYAEYL